MGPRPLSPRSWRPRRPLALALALALVPVGAGLAYVLFRVVAPEGYSNQVPNAAVAAVVPPGGELCQPDEGVPADATAVAVPVPLEGGRPARGRLEIAIRDGARTVLRAGPVSPRAPGLAYWDLPGRNPELAEARVCVRNRGVTPVAIGGVAEQRGPNATPALPEHGPEPLLDGQPQPGRIRVQYAGAERRAVWRLLPEVVRRAGLVKGSVVGGWSIWAAIVGMLGAVVLAVATVARVERR